MSWRDWVPVPDSWWEPDNGLSPKQEGEYLRWYDETVKRLRNGPGGRKAAQAFIDAEHRKYQVWRAAQWR